MTESTMSSHSTRTPAHFRHRLFRVSVRNDPHFVIKSLETQTSQSQVDLLIFGLREAMIRSKKCLVYRLGTNLSFINTFVAPPKCLIG